MKRDLETLQESIGYRFRRPELLEAALTHRSYAAERPRGSRASDYERLEFVGDAVLGLAAARLLSEDLPEAREGELTRRRAAIVGERGLATAARAMGLGAHVALGRGEERTGGREKASILAGALEALAGAVFLDGGWRCALRFARAVFALSAGATGEGTGAPDAKTRLQELCQERFRETPVYGVVDRTGPAHRPSFIAEARLGDRPLGRGSGRSRKAAEQAAAAAALGSLEG